MVEARPGPARPAVAFAIPALLCGVLLLQAGLFHRHKSITYDETFYAATAQRSVAMGRLDPELARHGVAPLPVLLAHLGPALLAEPRPGGDPWSARPGDREAVGRARLVHATVVGVGLLLTVYLWLLRRRGPWVAGLGAGLLALSPTVVAHVSLATTDAMTAWMTLLTLAALAAHTARPSWGRAGLVALAVAAAVASKYSALLLVPLSLGWMGAAAWLGARRGEAVGRRVAQGALVAAAVPLLVWALHGFAMVEAVEGDGGSLPAPWVGIQEQAAHQREGHHTYLLGTRSWDAGVAFYPVLLVSKATPAELMLLLVAAVTLVLRRRRLPAVESATSPRLWWLAVALFGGAALFSRVDLGHRYLLPLLVPLILWCVDRLAAWRPAAPRWGPWVAAALLLAQGVSAVSTAPHYLAYFNLLSGGSSRAHRIAVDSSLDWGQDLPALSRTLAEREPAHVVLSYFGTADPTAYGVRASSIVDREPVPDDGVLAISVTHLQGVYLKRDGAAALRELEPVGRAGYSILLYDLGDPRVRAVVAGARTP